MNVFSRTFQWFFKYFSIGFSVVFQDFSMGFQVFFQWYRHGNIFHISAAKMCASQVTTHFKEECSTILKLNLILVRNSFYECIPCICQMQTSQFVQILASVLTEHCSGWFPRIGLTPPWCSACLASFLQFDTFIEIFLTWQAFCKTGELESLFLVMIPKEVAIKLK